MILDQVTRFAANRRAFLKGAGFTGLGLAGAAMLGSPFAHAQATTTTYSDADILNFALNLEYLEAEFYSVATYGATLVDLGVLTAAQTSGPTTGGNVVPNFAASAQAEMATALRENEIEHVQYLRTALGSAAVNKPAINLAALGVGFASVGSWLALARVFEDVGVSAYLGAAPLITSSTYLAAAAAILATEAQHSGSIRSACIANGIASAAVDSLDVPPTQQAAAFYDVNSTNALSIPRTPAQVLAIVYAGGSTSGGFYPSGMNGAITS